MKRGKKNKLINLKDLSEENLDIFYYLNDIFNLEKYDLNDYITNALIVSSIEPILISSFTDCKKGVLSINLALYLVALLVKNFQDTPLVEFLLMKILGKNSLKNEPIFKFEFNKLTIIPLKEILGLIKNGKSPLEYLNLLKLVIERNSEDILIENSIRDILLYFMKVKKKMCKYCKIFNSRKMMD